MSEKIYGNYGVVEITEGKFKGQVGYYDDDEGEEGAVVYFGDFVEDGYELIPHEFLKKSPIKMASMEKFVRKNPAVAKMAGIKP